MARQEDGRIYADFAHALREDYPDTAQVFVAMAAEEAEHRRQLIDLFAARLGDHIPLVRRQDVKGNVARRNLNGICRSPSR
jgi:rubrerythrin